jgi:hypothetical protein
VNVSKVQVAKYSPEPDSTAFCESVIVKFGYVPLLNAAVVPYGIAGVAVPVLGSDTFAAPMVGAGGPQFTKPDGDVSVTVALVDPAVRLIVPNMLTLTAMIPAVG